MKVIPPVDPHPVSAAGLALYPTRAVMDVVRPVIVTVVAEEQVLDPSVAPVTATVVLATG